MNNLPSHTASFLGGGTLGAAILAIMTAQFHMDAALASAWLIVGAALAYAFVPYVSDNVQLRESLLLAAVYITLASNLNLMIGYTGYVNFGNIVFFGLGGYISLYMITAQQWPVVLAALLAGAAVSALALLFGLGILRLRGAFFALATIGVNQAVAQLVINF